MIIKQANGRVPEKFKNAELSDLDLDQFSAVMKYAERSKEKKKGPRKGLLLSGPPGVGKSYAMAALLNEFPDTKYVFMTAPKMLLLYQNVGTPHHSDWYGADWDDVFEQTPNLILNDLGKEYRAGNLGEQVSYKLGLLLRQRVESNLRTHITTNLVIEPEDEGSETLRRTYGESIHSLLREMVDMYEVEGPDLRVE